MAIKFTSISSLPAPIPKNRGKFAPIAKLPDAKAADPVLPSGVLTPKKVVLKPKPVAILPPSTDLPPKDDPNMFGSKTRPTKHAPIIEQDAYETNPGKPTKPETPICFAPEKV